jgi:LPXTG-motif cell wall-anchored protein
MRRAAVGAVGVMLIGLSTAYAGTEDPIEINGSQEIAVIDVDQNGELGGGLDCVFRAFVNTNTGALRIDPEQDAGDANLRVCNDDCNGSANMSTDFIEIIINSCPDWGRPPGAPFVPADLLVGTGLLFSTAVGAASGNGSGIQLAEGSLSYPAIGESAGEGLLCDLNGPAAAVTLFRGARVVRDLVPFPDASEPTHLCVNIPFELSGFVHIFLFRDICFPFNPNGNTEIEVDEEPVAFLSFENLPPCPATGGTAAPSMTVAGLVALMGLLLALGVWTLGRRRGFYEGLPLL